MRQQFLKVGLIASLSAASAFAVAEPAIQAGETLESLSKAKISTTVNGQPGSIQELVESGKVKLISEQQPAVAATQEATAVDPQATAPAEQNAPAAEQTQAPAEAAQPEAAPAQ